MKKTEIPDIPMNREKRGKLILRFLEGSKGLFLFCMCCAALSALADMIIPQIIRVTVDNVIGMKYGSLFDATQTMVAKIDDNTWQVQVVSWYDNENSYTSQMVRTIKYFAEL